MSGNGCAVTSSDINFAGGMVVEYRREQCAEPTMFTGNIFVLGDSHAMHYTSMLKQVVADTGAVIHTYTVGGCPYMSLQPRVAGKDELCKAFTDAAVANMLPKIKPGDFVFLPSLRIPRMVDQWADVGGLEASRAAIYSDVGRHAREDGIQQTLPTLKDIAARGARIILEAPSPMLESIPFRCADWFNKNNPICARGMSIRRADFENLRLPIIEAYKEIETEIPDVAIWDPLPFLCSETACSASREGMPLLFDGDHLTYYSNMLLYPKFVSLIVALESQP